jgi:molybdenum cofactor cytidylyltransferase
MKDFSVSCLLLCAGQSSRMEGANKLLMRFDSTSVLARSASQVVRAGFSDVVAVTGFEADLVEAELEDFQTSNPFAGSMRVVRNRFFENGMHSSIRVGLSALSPEAAFFAVALADQPLLTASDYAHLISAAREFPSAKLIAPVYAGVRGNPTLISMSLRSEILAHEDSDRGCSYLFERYPNEVYYLDMPFAQRNLDVDTRELLREAKEVLDASII